MVYEQQVCGLYDKNLVPVSFFFILQLELKTIDNVMAGTSTSLCH